MDTSAALRATQYLVLEVLPAPADHTESFLHEDYHCGYILNDYSNAKSDVTPHLDWHRTGDANVATEWARMKHGMYMWMTDRGHVPESSSKVEWHSLSLQGDSSGFTKKDQQQEVCSRTPLPLERAAPWISGGLDTGFWRLPKIFATEDGAPHGACARVLTSPPGHTHDNARGSWRHTRRCVAYPVTYPEYPDPLKQRY